MRSSLIATASLLALAAVPIATAQSTYSKEAAPFVQVKLEAESKKDVDALLGGRKGLSKAAMATAVLGDNGKPVGIDGYDSPEDAVKAGDMEAFLQSLRENRLDEDEDNGVAAMLLALDAAADGDTKGARDILDAAKDDRHDAAMFAMIEAWTMAMDGDIDEAIAKHRETSGNLPGLTADLSLAALLDAAGRPEQALAVYDFLTPSKIVAPQHDFDPQIIVYNHVQTVVSRHALLLARLERVEEAKEVYAKLAAAEPERAASYAAAFESLETGRGLDNEPLTIRSGFTQALSDLSRAIQQARIISSAMRGQRVSGFDEVRSAMDQVALLIDPTDEGLRSAVIDQLYSEALYEGVAHVATSAPEPTAPLQLAAAQAYLMQDDVASTKKAMASALENTDADNEFETVMGATQLYVFLDQEDEALQTAERMLSLAENDAERAVTHGLASGVYAHFEQFDRALKEAESARKLDDTHERRMVLANALADADRVEDGLKLIRNEHLTRPNDPYMLNTLGYYLITRTDRMEEGFRVLYRANGLAETDPYIADSLGWAFYQLGDLKSAVRLIEQSRRELAPKRHWEIEDHLGDIYWHQGEKKLAKEAWETALGERPPYDKRALIQGKLENGLTTPVPEKREIPRVDINDVTIDERDI